ncbi:class I SAM-dependent methyltransferase [Christiangramia crocea]|uniref:Class I SAM-dependent methyltransferase n=1 Tax=Christiangramia crocea TaxID=2904124 RepID=A0A9X1V097_9FLAO|nr:class I SAM-dependent methyltransferase [Gramella crocea]MCG9973121.1 class I SAM-dependent methyltransferase [Gramella crocea]
MLCSLCNSTTRNFEIFKEREYLQCVNCKAILLSPESYLSPQEEKFRYRLHNNDINDPGYINFVSPIIEKIKSDLSRDSTGLDFGCGTGPVIASELEKSGFDIRLYDPYFQPNQKLLKKKYDFIICCEVMEHFQKPVKEFRLLRSLLKPGGKLYCKTEVWNEAIKFNEWHYKNDLTHVIFYNRDSLLWIKENLQFSSIDIYEDLMVFSR